MTLATPDPMRCILVVRHWQAHGCRTDVNEVSEMWNVWEVPLLPYLQPSIYRRGNVADDTVRRSCRIRAGYVNLEGIANHLLLGRLCVRVRESESEKEGQKEEIDCYCSDER